MAIWNPRANEIFARILELPAPQRQAALEQACAGDDVLSQQVEALLAAHLQAGSFLDRPVNPAQVETVAPDANGVDPLLGIVRYVGDYELLAELGRGGIGVVYKARQASLQRLAALKMILPGGHAGPGQLARFRTECEAIARLQHPNIVQIHEVGEHEGMPFFSLEFCPGGGLDKRLNGTPWQPGEAAHLVETLARAMQAAHANNVIHRDLKPANVLLAADETPKITDFGLAKKLDEVGQTASGDIMGTHSYMAPEQDSTALKVAEDLQRFQEGLPVLARPVGRMERDWRWCKRNPVVAGLTVAVAVMSFGWRSAPMANASLAAALTGQSECGTPTRVLKQLRSRGTRVVVFIALPSVQMADGLPVALEESIVRDRLYQGR